MSAALEILPELQAAIEAAEAAAARLKSQLALVISEARSEGLSAIPSSVRRLACERRQANAARGDRSPGDRSLLSTIPSTVRKREWKRRQAAEKKARSIPDRSPPLDLQPVRTGEATAGGVLRTDRIPPGTHGPLAGDVASLVGRVTGYAESTRKRDRVWLYEEARRIWNEDLELHLPSQWTGPKDWGACRALVRDWDRDVLLKAVLDGGRAWKLAPGKWSRPTLGLVLHRLRLDSAATPAPAPKPDSRRMTGEQIEERDRARARAAAVAAQPKPRKNESAAAADCAPGPRPAGAVHPAGAAAAPAKDPIGIKSPAPPIGPRDLRGTPPLEVRGKIAEILEQLDAAKSRQGGVP
jgi:hypothetical protein